MLFTKLIIRYSLLVFFQRKQNHLNDLCSKATVVWQKQMDKCKSVFDQRNPESLVSREISASLSYSDGTLCLSGYVFAFEARFNCAIECGQSISRRKIRKILLHDYNNIMKKISHMTVEEICRVDEFSEVVEIAKSVMQLFVK